MADGTTTVGRGAIALTVSPSAPDGTPQTNLLRYDIQSSGIKFYSPVSSIQPANLLSLLPTLTGGRSFTVAGGHLSLVSLPASPQAAFRQVSLSVGTDAFTLKVLQTGEFARQSNTFFKNLDLRFTETQSGPVLKVEGEVTIVLFDQDIVLSPEFAADGSLVFKPKSALPLALAIAQLGQLDITTLEVGANSDRWAGLRALYTFDEPSGNLVLDSSGSRSTAGEAQAAIDLEIKTPALVQRLSTGGISVSGSPDIRSKGRASKIIDACRSSNEITIEAWVKPTKVLQRNDDRPARIVSLSKAIDPGERNFTLGQDIDSQGNNVYIVRLRRTQNNQTELNGLPPLVSRSGTVTANLSHVVFTRSATNAAQFYVNGVEQTDPNASANLSGDFSQWADSDDFPLMLANERTLTRPWAGEIHRIGIYSRALSKEEVFNSYFPSVKINATLTLSQLPAPLDQPLPVTLTLNDNRLSVVQKNLAIAPFLRFEEVNFVWRKTATQVELLSGSVKAQLWDNALTFDAKLTANELLLSLPKPAPNSPPRSLSLRESVNITLGNIALSQLDLRVNRSLPTPAWEFRTDGQVTFAIIPPPLKGAFPVELFLDASQIWFGISPAQPLKLVEQLVFDRANLRFVRTGSGWQVQPDIRENRGGVVLPLFSKPLSLTANLVPDGASKVLILDWTRPTTTDAPPPLSDLLGKLNLQQFNLKANPVTGTLFWQLLIIGQVPLGLSGQDQQAGILDFRTEDGQILGDPANAQSPTRLQGKSFLQSLTDPIFGGDLQLRGDRFFLNGRFNLFPNWSALEVNADTMVEIDPEGRLHFQTPVQVKFPDFVLLNPNLALSNGRLTLAGTWLGKEMTFTAIQRASQSIWEGGTTFDLPFSLALGPLYEPLSGVKLADQIRVCQELNCRQVMKSTVTAELSSSGFLARVNGAFQWQDETKTTNDLTVPEFTLFTPPTTRNALLGQVINEVKAHANEIFAPQFKPSSGYFFAASAEKQPLIYLGDRSGVPTDKINSILPKVFAADITVEIAPIFRLEQSGSECSLKINPASPLDHFKAYQGLFADLTNREKTGGLLPGAANLIKQRIAERLPMLVNQTLFYHYGLDTAESFLDLQAGMRLRVDYQTFQELPLTDRTTEKGFAGSSTNYYQLNTYLFPGSPGAFQYLLGFDPFLSQMQSEIAVDAALSGAASPIDLQTPAYRQPYFRLFYPNKFADLKSRVGPERAVAIVGATNLLELNAATQQYLAKNGAITSATNSRVSFFFRGRVVVTPEINVYVKDQPVYVPVGTTLRQLIETYSGIPTIRLQGNDFRSLQSQFRPRRLVHEGANNLPIYQFIALDNYQRFDNGTDSFDLPLVQGDRVSV